MSAANNQKHKVMLMVSTCSDMKRRFGARQMTSDLSQNSQLLNWCSHHINQDQDDANGFHLFGGDMNQSLVTIVT
jgi:hypothetical protein